MLLPSNVKDVIDLKLLEVWCSKYSACSMDTSSYSNVERRVTACGHLHGSGPTQVLSSEQSKFSHLIPPF